jgi:hypothetical protein
MEKCASAAGSCAVRPSLLPPLHPCKIYVHDASYGYDLAKLRPQHMARWLSAPFSTEIWLQKTLRSGHPWRVPRVADADLVFIAANFSTACAINTGYMAKKIWKELMGEPLWGPGTPPKAISWQFYQECGPMSGSNLAWKSPGIANNTIVLIDQLDQSGGPISIKAWTHVVTPFAISEPTWLISGSLPFPVPSWAERKLLFFGGHMPRPVHRLFSHHIPQPPATPPTNLHSTLRPPPGSIHTLLYRRLTSSVGIPSSGGWEGGRAESSRVESSRVEYSRVK